MPQLTTEVNMTIEQTPHGLTFAQAAEARHWMQQHAVTRMVDDIKRWCSIGALDITISESVIRTLVEEELITRVSDLYLLEPAVLEDKYTPSKVNTYLARINGRKAVSFARFIYGLNIDNIGRAAAAILAIEYPSIDALIDAEYSDILHLFDDPEIADSLGEYLGDSTNIVLMRSLEALGPKIVSAVAQRRSRNHWRGKRFMITGRFQNWDHATIRVVLDQFDITVTNSANTADYIIRGSGSKLKATRGSDAVFWTERQFESMFVECD